MCKIPDWEKKYWQQKHQQKLDKSNYVKNSSDDWDITDSLMARVAQKAFQYQEGSSTRSADLVEGYPYYVKLQSDAFGHAFSLFKTAGTIGGSTSKNVLVESEITGYLIDNLSYIDMSKLTEKSEFKISLVKVLVPFVGTFFVQKEAVIFKDSGVMGGARKLLKD